MAGILLKKQKLYEYLKSLGHEPTEDFFSGKTGNYRFWKTRWGHVFSVPDDEHACPTWILEEIADAVNKTRPPVH